MASTDTTGPVRAYLHYLTPDSLVNRRFVAPAAELNTGRYEPHEVLIRNARLEQGETLDRMGFTLVKAPTAVTDFRDPAAIDGPYAEEVAAAVKAALGADLVIPMGGIVRTSGMAIAGESQPPANDVHVDFTPERAPGFARMLLERSGQGGRPIKRFVVTSFWRALSPAPQDWPLALCDCRSVGVEEGVPNVMKYVDALPEGEAQFATLPDEDTLPAASVFHYNPAHRWYYYPDLTRDEAVLIKFNDSDNTRAWRTPHTAFHDLHRIGAIVRESVEMRSVAYFF